MDAKLGFDENAEFRQKDVFQLRDRSQEDPAEVNEHSIVCILDSLACPADYSLRIWSSGRGRRVWTQLHQTGRKHRLLGQRCWSCYGHHGRPQTQRRWVAFLILQLEIEGGGPSVYVNVLC